MYEQKQRLYSHLLYDPGSQAVDRLQLPLGERRVEAKSVLLKQRQRDRDENLEEGGATR